MKFITILGSPKKNGNTAKALRAFEETLISKGQKIERINIADYQLNGCLGCNACLTNQEKPSCVQDDDLIPIFLRMLSADGIIYASPLYAFAFPAQIKSFIDRHYCLVTNPGLPNQSSIMEGKRVALLMTCSDGIENNADLIQLIFDRVFNRLNCKIIGKYVITSSAAPDFSYRASQLSKRMASEIIKNY